MLNNILLSSEPPLLNQFSDVSQVYNKVNCVNTFCADKIFLLSFFSFFFYRIGDEVMMNILENLSIFTAAPPSCFIQLTGISKF